MYSLFHSLLAQHPRQIKPVRCAEQTITQLHRYFEDVVLENKLSALVVESLPFVAERQFRDLARAREICEAAKSSFLFISQSDTMLNLKNEDHSTQSVLFELPSHYRSTERFVVIADARFSALLASVPSDEEDQDATTGTEVIWTFEPDVVYSALEYLMARVTAEFPEHSAKFSQAVSGSMPKSTSLQLAISVTTKLAQLLQAQAEREIAVNRIATAIRNSVDLDCILQTAADEVGRALSASSCAIRVSADSVAQPTTKCYLRRDLQADEAESSYLAIDLDALEVRLAKSPISSSNEGNNSAADFISNRGVVPLNHQGRLIGLLLVRSDDASRSWAESELLLLHTVADQVTVAINQAHLFSLLQQQALTDGLTDCYNRRAFEMQLERDMHFSTRMQQPLSLLMLDLDNLKLINDRYGHPAGDLALRMLADTMRAELRAVDTPARFGGDEFALILPQANLQGALLVADRLRKRIEMLAVPGIDSITASFGFACFPVHASSRDTLVMAADRALYRAKHSGRNCVCLPDEDEPESRTETPAKIEFVSEAQATSPTPRPAGC